MYSTSSKMEVSTESAETRLKTVSVKAPGWVTACELFIKHMLNNRFVWLIFGCALYINGHLTYLQWSTAKHGAQQFDTFELMSHLLVVIEFSTLAIIMLLIGAVSNATKRWRNTTPDAPFPYFAYACAMQLTAACFMLAQLLILLYPHSYPQLIEEGINIPLMLSQRAFLVFLALCTSANVGWLFRFYTKLPLQVCAIIMAVFHVVFGYTATLQSLRFESLVRLNSVFYYNELWRYMPDFPDLRHASLFHNIQMPYFAYFVIGGLILTSIPTILWVPRAIISSKRETRTHSTQALP